MAISNAESFEEGAKRGRITLWPTDRRGSIFYTTILPAFDLIKTNFGLILMPRVDGAFVVGLFTQLGAKITCVCGEPTV